MKAEPQAASCAYVLTLGKRHAKYAPSTYRACITPTQAMRLFGTTGKPRPIGCGVFACVFPHADANKVVKITRDPSDVAGLQQAQGLQVPKLFVSHKLVGRPWWTAPRRREQPWQQWPDQLEAFALVLERLRPLVGVEKALWNKRIRRMQKFQLAMAQTCARRASPETPTVPMPTRPVRPVCKPPTISDMAKAVCPKKPLGETTTCRLRIRELNKIAADLRERGVDWADIHAGNIGVDSRGRWRALDLGASPTPLKTDPPLLYGR